MQPYEILRLIGAACFALSPLLGIASCLLDRAPRNGTAHEIAQRHKLI